MCELSSVFVRRQSMKTGGGGGKRSASTFLRRSCHHRYKSLAPRSCNTARVAGGGQVTRCGVRWAGRLQGWMAGTKSGGGTCVGCTRWGVVFRGPPASRACHVDQGLRKRVPPSSVFTWWAGSLALAMALARGDGEARHQRQRRATGASGACVCVWGGVPLATPALRGTRRWVDWGTFA